MRQTARESREAALSLGKEVLQVLAEGANVHREPLGHWLARLPDRLMLLTGIDALRAGVASTDREFGSAGADQLLVAIGHQKALRRVNARSATAPKK